MCTWIQSLTVNLISKKFPIISFGKQYFLLLLFAFFHNTQHRWCRQKLRHQPLTANAVVRLRALPCSTTRFRANFIFLPIFSVSLLSRNALECLATKTCVCAECTTNNTEGSGPRKNIHSTATAIAKVVILLMCVQREHNRLCSRRVPRHCSGLARGGSE